MEITIKQLNKRQFKIRLDIGGGTINKGVLDFGEKEESPVTLFGGKLRHDPYHTGRLQVLRRGDVDWLGANLTEDDALMIMARRGSGEYQGGIKY